MSARAPKAAPARLLHLHSSFDPGGKELRAVQLMNAFGRGVEHTVITGTPGAMGAATRVARGIPLQMPDDFPPLQGRPLPARLQSLARAMQGYDLVLTYNFGAMDAVMAHTLFGGAMRLPPLVHHEDGFNADEATRRKTTRNWYRRIALGRASALVVCSHVLEGIALGEWHQPPARIRRIANGINTAAYTGKPRADALPRVIKRPGERWLGTLAGLRPVKNLPRLVRGFAGLPDNWQLVIAGYGPETQTIRDEALRLGVGHRVHLPGHVAEPAAVVGLFDLFALSSDSEQFPISVLEAMAAGLAVVSTDAGDVRAMLPQANRRFIVPMGDEAAFAGALSELAGNDALRAQLGAENRARARAEYDEKTMVATYRAVYETAMGRKL